MQHVTEKTIKNTKKINCLPPNPVTYPHFVPSCKITSKRLQLGVDVINRRRPKNHKFTIEDYTIQFYENRKALEAAVKFKLDVNPIIPRLAENSCFRVEIKDKEKIEKYGKYFYKRYDPSLDIYEEFCNHLHDIYNDIKASPYISPIGSNKDELELISLPFTKALVTLKILTLAISATQRSIDRFISTPKNKKYRITLEQRANRYFLQHTMYYCAVAEMQHRYGDVFGFPSETIKYIYNHDENIKYIDLLSDANTSIGIRDESYCADNSETSVTGAYCKSLTLSTKLYDDEDFTKIDKSCFVPLDRKKSLEMMLSSTNKAIHFAGNILPSEILTALYPIDLLHSSFLYIVTQHQQSRIDATFEKEQLDKAEFEQHDALEHSQNEARDIAESEQYLRSLQAFQVEKRRQAIRNHKAAARSIRQERRHYMCDGSQALSRTYQAVEKPKLPPQTNTLCQIPHFKSIFDELGTRRVNFSTFNHNTITIS